MRYQIFFSLSHLEHYHFTKDLFYLEILHNYFQDSEPSVSATQFLPDFDRFSNAFALP